MTTQTSKHRRLILFPLPFQGHINPMIQLAKILHSTGFTISIIHTAYNFPNPAVYPRFTFHRISDGFSESNSDLSDPILFLKRLVGSCAEPFERCLSELLSGEDEEDRVACLITDAIWYFAQDVAEKVGVPRVVLRTSNVCSFVAFAALPSLREKGYSDDKVSDSKLEDPISELPPLRIKDIPTMETSDRPGLDELVTNMVRQTQGASGLIFNTFYELEQPDFPKLQHHFSIPIFPIGPFHKCFSASSSSLLPQDRTSIPWLDKQAPRSVLYVSFGSIAAMDAERFNEVAHGLANSEIPFLWVVRPGSVRGSEWLEMLPDELLSSVQGRSHIVRWAPQQEILSHPAVGGFWTHGGWNSTLESICEGVPMICSPFFGDQTVNSRYVSDVWRVGIRLEKGLERGEIEESIRQVMVGSEGEEMRKRVELLKEKADACLRDGGSSQQALDGLVRFISSLRS